jgi:chitodextrinase
MLAFGAAPAGAIANETGPVWPIPADAPPTPPPVPTLPAAAATPPPASAIADPITPSAVCGDWYLQSDYGDRWPAANTWWEYRCTRDHSEYYPHPCEGSICQPVCYGYPWDCYWLTEHQGDHFYWNGFDAVLYGQFYAYAIEDDAGLHGPWTHWWDELTTQWYRVESDPPPASNLLTVFKAGTGSGTVRSTPAGIDCGSSCEARFNAGAEVTLSATPDASSVFTGWSGDCSGTASCQVTLDQTRSVTATFAEKPPANAAPTASFGVSCAGLVCSLDGGGSSDSDGTIEAYSWDFGDNSTGANRTAQHSYAQAGSYTVKLTVTDDDGASGSASKVVAPISGLSARGYKVKGLQKVDLAWSGSSAGGFDVYRDGLPIATVAGTSYTDNLNGKGSGRYAYKVCQTTGAICSNQATVSF